MAMRLGAQITLIVILQMLRKLIFTEKMFLTEFTVRMHGDHIAIDIIIPVPNMLFLLIRSVQFLLIEHKSPVVYANIA